MSQHFHKYPFFKPPLMKLVSHKKLISVQFACLQIGFRAVSDRTLIDCLLAVCHLTLREKFPSGGSDFWLNPEVLRTHTKSDCSIGFIHSFCIFVWQNQYHLRKLIEEACAFAFCMHECL